MRKHLIILLAMIPFSLLSKNKDGFDYEEFKNLFSKQVSATGGLVKIPHNDFTDFLFNDQITPIYYAVEMVAINDDIDLFVINEEEVYDDEYYIHEFYLIFKGKELVGEYNYYSESSHILGINVTSDGGTISQSYKIQDDKSISIEYYHLDCCSSTGFEIPIEIKTRIDFHVNDKGELAVKDVLKWEINSPFFNSNFQDFIAENQTLLYPTADNSYNITIDNSNAYIPITNNDDQIFFFFDYKGDKLVPVLQSKNKEGQVLDSLIIGENIRETDRAELNKPKGDSNFYSNHLLIIIDNLQAILSLDNYGHFVVEMN